MSGVVLCWTLFAAACSSPPPVTVETPEAWGPTVEAEPKEPEPTVGVAVPTQESVVEPKPKIVPTTVATPVGTGHSWMDERHFGKAVASIAERLYLADVVVRARFVSASDGTINFRAVEYLKGTVDPTFSVVEYLRGTVEPTFSVKAKTEEAQHSMGRP